MSGRFGPQELLDCYRRGVFPMGNAHDDPSLFLVDPEHRGVLPLKGFHVPKKLRKVVRSDVFDVTVDQAFTRVMEACAAPAEGRESTWINSPIVNLYSALHRMGHAHSVEVWYEEQLGRRIVRRFSAIRFLRRKHVFDPDGCFKGRARPSSRPADLWRLHDARRAVHHRSFETVRRI